MTTLNTNNASQTEELFTGLAVLALLGAITLGSVAAVENSPEVGDLSTNTQVQNVI